MSLRGFKRILKFDDGVAVSDSPIGANSHRECGAWLMDDEGDDQETVLADSKEAAHRKLVLSSAVVKHTTRGHQIVVRRRLG
jgi:hypothetical protein